MNDRKTRPTFKLVHLRKSQVTRWDGEITSPSTAAARNRPTDIWTAEPLLTGVDKMQSQTGPGNVPKTAGRSWECLEDARQVPLFGTFRTRPAAVPTREVSFRGKALAHHGFPPMLRVWEISTFPITRHPSPPRKIPRHQMASRGCPLVGIPPESCWVAPLLELYIYISLPYIIEFFPVHLNSARTNNDELKSKENTTYRRCKTRLIPLTPASNR